MSSRFTVRVVTFVVLFCGLDAAHGGGYKVFDLGTIGDVSPRDINMAFNADGSEVTATFAINAKHQVVGYADVDPSPAVAWQAWVWLFTDPATTENYGFSSGRFNLHSESSLTSDESFALDINVNGNL